MTTKDVKRRAETFLPLLVKLHQKLSFDRSGQQDRNKSGEKDAVTSSGFHGVDLGRKPPNPKPRKGLD